MKTSIFLYLLCSFFLTATVFAQKANVSNVIEKYDISDSISILILRDILYNADAYINSTPITLGNKELLEDYKKKKEELDRLFINASVYRQDIKSGDKMIAEAYTRLISNLILINTEPKFAELSQYRLTLSHSYLDSGRVNQISLDSLISKNFSRPKKGKKKEILIKIKQDYLLLHNVVKFLYLRVGEPTVKPHTQESLTKQYDDQYNRFLRNLSMIQRDKLVKGRIYSLVQIEKLLDEIIKKLNFDEKQITSTDGLTQHESGRYLLNEDHKKAIRSFFDTKINTLIQEMENIYAKYPSSTVYTVEISFNIIGYTDLQGFICCPNYTEAQKKAANINLSVQRATAVADYCKELKNNFRKNNFVFFKDDPSIMGKGEEPPLGIAPRNLQEKGNGVDMPYRRITTIELSLNYKRQ